MEVDAEENAEIDDGKDLNSGLQFRGDVLTMHIKSTPFKVIEIGTHCEQGDVELSNGIERESGKDVNTGGNESEDVDGQLLDEPK